MRLTKVRIREFQSIQDSNEFDIGDVTCLVGKNEAGKTALLKALYRLNPIRSGDGDFDVVDDYPRRERGDYEERVEIGERNPAEVVQATFELEPEDIDVVTNVFGPECFTSEPPTVSLHKGYTCAVTYSGLPFDHDCAIAHLVQSAGLPQQLSDELLEQTTVQGKLETLSSAERTESVEKLESILSQISQRANVAEFICESILHERIPRFLYFDEYYQMKGQDNLDAFINRVNSNILEDADQPLFGLIKLARLDVNLLIDPQRTEELEAELESAANQLTGKLIRFWSQNRHLQMTVKILPARQGDPADMQNGTNIWVRVYDTKHWVSTRFSLRSKGFIWFFSFLAWYSYLRRKGENLILLLDEPGLSLHAKAQSDLLRYFEQELKPNHQLIYTTHSPFMVDPANFDRVRIVQDLSIDFELEDLAEEQKGTRVSTDVLQATSDSLFPLQGALGYGITQSLFIGPNCLVVEGASDLKYLQEMSTCLQRLGKVGLKDDWTITPVGGSTNVPTFVALLGAQEDLNLVVLIDYQKRDRQRRENLFKEKLLKKSQVLTFADFVAEEEADIEDMFDPEFYLKLVNGEFATSVTIDNLPSAGPRIVRRLKKYFEGNPLPSGATFNHTRPARYFSDHIGSLENEIGEETLDRFERMFTHLNELL